MFSCQSEVTDVSTTVFLSLCCLIYRIVPSNIDFFPLWIDKRLTDVVFHLVIYMDGFVCGLINPYCGESDSFVSGFHRVVG